MTQDIQMDRYPTENRDENRRYENSPHIECCNCLIYLPKQNSNSNSIKMMAIIFGLFLVFLALVLGLYFGINHTNNDMSETTTTTTEETTPANTQTSVTTILTSTSKIF